MSGQVIEGTWEEIVQHAEELAGHHLRVFILDIDDETKDDINPHALEEAIATLVNRTPEEIERTRTELFKIMDRPRPLPEGKGLIEVISGQWPGDETDNEISEALKRVS